MRTWTDYVTTEEDYNWNVCKQHRQANNLPTEFIEDVECADCPARPDCPLHQGKDLEKGRPVLTPEGVGLVNASARVFTWVYFPKQQRIKEFKNDDLKVIEEPLPYGMKVRIMSDRHDLDLAYLLDSVTVHGGGYRYRAVFPNEDRAIFAKVYTGEFEVIGVDEDETDRLLQKAS
jgi:hypothetical protein